MGPVVTKAQQAAALKGIGGLAKEAKFVSGGADAPKLDGIDPSKSSFVSPTLLKVGDAKDARAVHEIEVFGPVSTVIPYGNESELFALVSRGGGSLVASVYGDDLAFLAKAVNEIGPFHGRVLAVDPVSRRRTPDTASSCRSATTADPDAPAMAWSLGDSNGTPPLSPARRGAGIDRVA